MTHTKQTRIYKKKKNQQQNRHTSDARQHQSLMRHVTHINAALMSHIPLIREACTKSWVILHVWTRRVTQEAVVPKKEKKDVHLMHTYVSHTVMLMHRMTLRNHTLHTQNTCKAHVKQTYITNTKNTNTKNKRDIYLMHNSKVSHTLRPMYMSLKRGICQVYVSKKETYTWCTTGRYHTRWDPCTTWRCDFLHRVQNRRITNMYKTDMERFESKYQKAAMY